MQSFFKNSNIKAVGITLLIMSCTCIAAAVFEIDSSGGSNVLYLVSEISTAFICLVTGGTLITYFYASGNTFLFIASTALFTNGLGIVIHALILWSNYNNGLYPDYSNFSTGVFIGQFVLGFLTLTALLVSGFKTSVKPVENRKMAYQYGLLYLATVLLLLSVIISPVLFKELFSADIINSIIGYTSAIFFIASFALLVKKFTTVERSPIIWGSMTGVGVHSAGYLMIFIAGTEISALIPPLFFRATGFAVALMAFIFQKILLVQKLYHQRNELRKSRKMLQDILDTIPMSVFWKDTELNYLGCNRHFAEDAGLKSTEEVIGRNDYELNWSNMAELYRQDDKSVINSGLPKLNYEEPLGLKDLKSEWIRTSKIPLRDNNSTTFGILGVYENITEKKNADLKLKKYTEDLEELNIELKDKNRELDEFVFIASHDLQEPLRKVIAFSDLLKKDAGDNLPEMAVRDLGFITESVTRMSRLLSDLLRYSRSNSKELSISRVPFENVVRDAIDNLSARIEESEALIEYGDLPRIYCDHTFMVQVIQNIFANAIKYTRNRPHIRMEVMKDRGYYRFIISDNGIGIKQEYLEQIFSPFRRLHSKHEYEGSGIGLSICRKIIRRHGGTIHAESSENRGTSFIFTMPVSKE